MSLSIGSLLNALPAAASLGFAATCLYASSSKHAFNRVKRAHRTDSDLTDRVLGIFLKTSLGVTTCIRAFKVHPLLLFPFASALAYLSMNKCLAIANRMPPLAPNINLTPPLEPGVTSPFELRARRLQAAMDVVFAHSDLQEIIGDKWIDQSIASLTEASEIIKTAIINTFQDNGIDPNTVDLSGDSPTTNPKFNQFINSWKEVGKVLGEVVQDEKRWDVNWALQPWQLRIQTLLSLNIVGMLIRKVACSMLFGPLEYLELAGLFVAFYAISKPKFIEFKKVTPFNGSTSGEFDLRAYFPACFVKKPKESNSCRLCLDELTPESVLSPSIVSAGCEGNHLFHAQCLSPHIREKTSAYTFSIEQSAIQHYTEYRDRFPTLDRNTMELDYNTRRVYGRITDISYTLTIDSTTPPNCPLCREAIDLDFTITATEQREAFLHTRKIDVPAVILIQPPEATEED